MSDELMYGAVAPAGFQVALRWSPDCLALTRVGATAAGGLMTDTGAAAACETRLSWGPAGHVDVAKNKVSF
jgi:hypothetical protein